MSFIYGIINNIKALNHEDTSKLKESYTCRPHHIFFEFSQKNIFFGEIKKSGCSTFHQSADNNWVVISEARIDNRDELIKKLGNPYPQGYLPCENELILMAFLKWGNNCVNYLLGDWSFAIWNKLTNNLFLARDHHGISSIYYSVINNCLRFSSALKSLIEPNEEINKKRLIEITLTLPGNGHDTVYKNIKQLPPAHYLEFTNNTLKTTRYWDPIVNNNYFTITPNALEDELQFLLYDSVKARLDPNLKNSTMLSSGLDSSTISVIAANMLAKQNKKLYSYTSVPYFTESQKIVSKNRIADEGPLASLIASFNGNIEHYLINSANSNPLDSLKEAIEIHHCPVLAPANQYWMLDILKKAKQHQVDNILLAIAGNATISWPPTNIQSSGNIYTSIKSFFRNSIKYKEYVTFISQNLYEWKSYHQYQILKLLESTIFEKGYLSKAELNEFIDSTSKQLKQLETKDLKYQMLLPGTNYTGSYLNQLALHFDINITDPTADRRLIELSMAATEKNIKLRPILIKLMNNAIPTQVLYNKKRGIQAADITFRTKEYIGSFENEFDNATIQELINVKKLQCICSEIKLNPYHRFLYLKIQKQLFRGLNLSTFYKFYEKQII